MNMTRYLNHFKKPMLPSIFIGIWPLFGLYLWLQMESLFALIIGSFFAVLHYRKWRRYQRAQYIEQYAMPLYLLHDLRREYQLDSVQLPIIERGFKDFCLIHLEKPNQLHNMPSKAVDALWHAFILDTRSYAEFCQRAFGHMLHHRPSLDMQALSNTTQQKSLKATWLGACQLENFTHTHAAQLPLQLPLLFAIDQYLAWPQGLHYQLDQLQHLLRVRDASSSCGGGSCGGTSVDISDNSSSGGDSGCGGGCGGD